MITNGTLLDKHINVIKKHVDRLYISIDCPEEIHNKIRRKRAHLKILSAIKKPNHSKETVISVTAENILNTLPGFSDNFNSLNIKSLYLQDMIVLSKHKRDKYKLIMKCQNLII